MCLIFGAVVIKGLPIKMVVASFINPTRVLKPTYFSN